MISKYSLPKIVVIGADGQLGTDLCPALQHFEVIPLTINEIEISDMESVKRAFNKYKPHTIINTAAFVRVDDCEEEQDKAFSVNSLGARNVAVVAQEIGAKLAHISTDYVLGGGNDLRITPYTEFDTPIPLNLYGKSKLAGEKFVQHLCSKYFIIRSSALFGIAGSSGKGGNFVETIIKLAREKDKLTVIDDQIFSPTYTKDLSEKISQIIATELYGTFHITNGGECSWYDFAKEILRLVESKTPIEPITSDQYPQKAKRPYYSVLAHDHLRLLGMDDLRHWQKALAAYMKEKKHCNSS